MSRAWHAFCLLLSITFLVNAAFTHDSIVRDDDVASSKTAPLSAKTLSTSTQLPVHADTNATSSHKPHDSFFSYTKVPLISLNFSLNGSIPPNWVGPSIGDYVDTACYRKQLPLNSHGHCPQGYRASHNRCWAQCPMAYPVQCFSQCIPQNDDCALELMSKIVNPGYVALNFATAGVFNALHRTFKTVKRSLMCAFTVFNIAEGISRFLRYRQLTSPNGTKEELLAAVYQTDLFLVDLPVTITACTGHKIPRYAFWSDAVVTAAEVMVKQLLTNPDMILSSVDAFVLFFMNTTIGKSTFDLDKESVTSLKTLIASGSTCGFELKRLTDRVIMKVDDMRETHPKATKEDLRTFMSDSSIVQRDVPNVTNYCMGELLQRKKPYAAYQTRDVLRKTFGVIIDQLIDRSTTDFGVEMTRQDYWSYASNLGLLALSALDPTGIAFMTYYYVQPLCGPTEFIGEVDDGSATDALGLATQDDAFHGSHGTWMKKGDGNVKMEFVSTDIKDVDVNIYSGGHLFATVRVCRGETRKWTSTVMALQDKTMYLDRWRSNFVGLPTTGGGSLLLWVPRSSEGGHLELTIKINRS